MSPTKASPRARDGALSDWRDRALAFEREVGKAVIGQERAIRLLSIALLARGHVLLEGDVGVGKTTLLRAAARALGGAYARVEGTIDLMPGDLVYHAYVGEDGRPRVEPGPALSHGEDLSIFFFNEINRARPQVHALLLRLMAEHSLTAFNREWRFPHLHVFADRNRIEREETFELPAAARDRFFMEIAIATPAAPDIRRALIFAPRFHDADALLQSVAEGVLDHRELGGAAAAIQAGLYASDALERYALDLWSALRAPAAFGVALEGVDMDRLIQGGASPRGMACLIRAARVNAWLEGRAMVTPEDLRAVFVEVMAHRVFLDPVYEIRRERIMPGLLAAILSRVAAP